MSRLSIARLRRMTPDEIAWRSRQAGRTVRERWRLRLRPPAWHRRDIGQIVAKGVLPQSTNRTDWQSAHDALERTIVARASRFALDPASLDALRAHVVARWPDAASDATARANAILGGQYDVLGYRGLRWAAPGGGVDWHLDPVHQRRAALGLWADVPYLDPSIGDHKVIWEINRHQHWLQLGRAFWLTGDRRCAEAIVEQLGSWLAANPPLTGINWASMLEIGLRSISWMWGLHFLLGDTAPRSPWLIDLFVGLHRQLTHLEQNLSVYFSPNTHLTGEALALYVVGVALPELAASPRWTETGRRLLLAEIDRQIEADGGHVERSTHYQRYTLDFYLMALLTAERANDAEAAARFSAAVERLADFTLAMADDHGRLPVIGDDDGGMLWPIAGRACADVRDSLSLAAILLDRPALAPWGIQEEAVWIAGRRAIDAMHRSEPGAAPSARTSRTFTETGYVVARDDAGGHAVFDVGPHGYMNSGHAHADALALTLTIDGQPLLIDPGTSTYTMDSRLRDRLRASMSHNTVSLEGRSQAAPRGPFHWRTRADARLHASRHNTWFDWAEASHDGYAPARHRRSLVRVANAGWLVLDEILGHGSILASAHWHFDPRWQLALEAQGALCARSDAREVWLLHDSGEVVLAHGDTESGLGWCAPIYGVLSPTWTARVDVNRDAPFAIVSWLGGLAPGATGRPTIERPEVSSDCSSPAFGFCVAHESRRSTYLLRPGEPPFRESRAARTADYHTDARLLHYVIEANRLRSLNLADAGHAHANHQDWISVVADATIRDLHVAVLDDTLDLQASVPPGRLRLESTLLSGIHRIRLNSREHQRRAGDGEQSMEILSPDWGVHGHESAQTLPLASLGGRTRDGGAAFAPSNGRKA